MDRSSSLRKIVFIIEMPEPIAMPQLAEFTFWLDERVPELDGVTLSMSPNSKPISFPEGRSFVHLQFWQVTSSLRLPFSDALFKVVEQITGQGEHDAVGPDLESYRTVVESTTLMIGGENENALSAAFDRCLVQLQQLCRAFRSTTHERISRVSVERLPLIIPYSVSNLYDRFQGVTGWFMLHANFPDNIPRDPISDEELNRLHEVLMRQSQADPFLLAQEQSDEARRLLYRAGDYGDAVMHAHLAAEIFLDGVLLYMLWESGATASEVAKLFDDGLAKRVRRDFAPNLGGNWNTDKGPMASFAANLMKIRGRVVHGGYEPSRGEAETALDTYIQVVDFVKSRLAEKRFTFPRTTLMVLGQPGLERMGLWKGKVTEVWDRLKDEPSWASSFRDWRDEVDSHRT